MITFYDLAGRKSLGCWSHNPRKACYVLNYKKLPYQSVQLDYETVDSTIREAGFPPSRHNPDGTPKHTVPSIFDDSTGERITDSYLIAEYLDKQYPDTPKAFPPGTEALQAAFYQHFNDRFLEIMMLFLPHIPGALEKQSTRDHFYRNMITIFGKPLEEMKPKGEELENLWKKVFALLDSLEGWYAKSSGGFLVGDKPSFGDFTVGASLRMVKILLGEESEDWKKVAGANGRRWERLLNDLEVYA
ncbi:hypothetical protein NP233_g4655 [Leucocoprinus birnbaumii]|uniref:GST N-terminal domain-containing protein n=1 Tax=Leucocoprinus birnbaumii TaxID=56174 RepID=A0AAD5VX03_9AGAR|nr:hypothetical protein NP233_g4655 [Leucocoprinus birnbaumii]